VDDTPTGVVNVEIFGQQYPIRSQLDHVYVLKLARYLDRKMQAAAEQVHGGDSVRVAVLAALNIADEHFKTLAAQEDRELDAQRLALEIEQLVDDALEQSS
jgi:cell division protein ZapA